MVQKNYFLLLFLLVTAFSYSAFAGNYGYSPSSHLYLGGGMNPFKPDENYLDCIEYDSVVSLDTKGAVSTEVEMKLLEKREDFYKSTSFSASVSGSYSFFKGEASISSVEETRFHSDSLTWIILFKTNYGKYSIVKPRLADEYKSYSQDDIYRTCGSEIVKFETRGVMAFALLTIHHLSESKKSELKAKFGAEAKGIGWGVKMDAQYSSLIASAMASKTISISIKAIGGNGLIDLRDLLITNTDTIKDSVTGQESASPAIDYMRVPSVLHKYIGGMTAENAVATEYSTVAMSSFVRNLPVRFDKFLTKQVETIYFKYLDYKVLRDRIDSVVSGGSSLSPHDIAELSSVRDVCDEMMNTIYLAGRACVEGDISQCIIPRGAIPYVDFNKYKSDSDTAPYFAIETYCNNSECGRHKQIKAYKKKIGESIVLTNDQIDYGTCEECRHKKDTRFCFKNCKYQIRGQVSQVGTIITNDDRAEEEEKYFFPYEKSRDRWQKIRITTYNNN